MAEFEAGRLLGPVPQHLPPSIHTSPLRLVLKAHQVNKWCMICDPSSSTGSSVNKGVPSDLCSLRYASVDDTVNLIAALTD